MHTSASFATGLRALAIITLIATVNAHTWAERVRRIAANGTMVGETGYARGYIARDSQDPPFADALAQNQLPVTGQAAYSGDEVLNKYSFDPNPKWPMLEAAAGDKVAIMYLENGHTTIPENQPNKPRNRGTVFLYGTSEPAQQEKLFDVHLLWNKDGTGGDGRGRLLATRNFDDGQCYQPNNRPIALQRASSLSNQGANPNEELSCQTAVTLPEDLEPGSVYTVYWYWDWPDLNPEEINMEATENGVFPWAGSFMRDGQDPTGLPASVIARNESYSSAIDIKIVERTTALGAITVGAANFIQDQNVYSQAIRQQMENNFIVDVDPGSPQQPGSPSPPSTPSSSVGSPTATTPGSILPTDSPLVGAPGNGLVETVTVTATLPPTTLVTTVYETMTVETPLASEQSQSSSESTSTVVVTLTTRVPALSTVVVTQTAFVPGATPSATISGGSFQETVIVEPPEIATTSTYTPAPTPVPTPSVFLRRRANWAFGFA
jgi:hypothetical protein